MQQCVDTLQDFVGNVDQPLAQPTGGKGSGCDLGDHLAYGVWTVLVEYQRANSEKFAARAALSLLQPRKQLDSLSWTIAHQRGGDIFTFQRLKLATRGGVLHWKTANGWRCLPKTAIASHSCCRCLDLGVHEDLLKHWHL